MGETDDAGTIGAPPRNVAPAGRAPTEGANGAAAPAAGVAPAAPTLPQDWAKWLAEIPKLMDPVYRATLEAQKGHLEPLLALVRGAQAKVVQLGAELAAQRQEIEALRAANTALEADLAAERRLRVRLAAALEGVVGEAAAVPSTVGELRVWRTAQGYTQREAAEALGVGHATIERAEKQPDRTALGRALRAAFARDVVELAEVLGAQRRAEAEQKAAARQCADLAATIEATRPVDPATLKKASAATGGKATAAAVQRRRGGA